MRFTKKPVEIDADQWFKNGDHPLDHADGRPADWEGEVVRYFRRPDVPGATPCKKCGATMHVHGWIDTLEGGHIVCPGDWIITGIQGERYPCKPDIFRDTYEEPVTLYGLWRVDEEPAKTGWLTTHGGRVIVSEDPDELAQYSRYEVREVPPVIVHAEWLSNAGIDTPAKRPVIRSGPEHYSEGVRLLSAAAGRQDDGQRLYGEQCPSDPATALLTERAHGHLLAARVASHAAAEHPDSVAWQQALGQ